MGGEAEPQLEGVEPEVDDLYAAARGAGALGGKLTGAGGGGFLLLFVPPAEHQKVRVALRRLLWLPFDFEFSGSQTSPKPLADCRR